APPADLPPLERRLLDVLKRERKTHIDELCRLLDLGSAEVGSALLLLEMKNLVRQWPGMSYTLFEDDGAYGS
ncbi:MAG: DNA-protecting protein DprA, partial [Desulfovibrionaceae bacterium]|nr:DNA-protecting protein DprA [Desulfovibrionaceae bacterium]